MSLSLDSPLQPNDALNLSLSDTLNHGPRYSRSTSLFYSIPYGYWTYSLFVSHVEYRSPFKLSTTTLYNSGRTDQVNLGQFYGQPWQWQSQLSAQYSPDSLPSIEQLLVTDDSVVRGYRENSASGAIWRNTLRLPLNSDLPVKITPRLWLDNAWVKREHGAQSQGLSDASVGFNLSWKSVQLDFDYQRNLNTPTGFGQEKEVWLTRLRVQI